MLVQSIRALAALLLACVLPTSAASQPLDEVRALWVVRTSLTSPSSVEAIVRTARDHGFNTVLVQVRGRGDAYFTGGVDPRAAALAFQQASFDPLQALIASAHAEGLRVHAWVNVNLVASANDLPASRQHIVYRHPEWLMVPRDLAEQLATIEPDTPSYLGRLSRWTREHLDAVEGLYLSPLAPGTAEYTAEVLDDLVARYPVDGIHLDYIRFPDDRFDFSRSAMAELRADVRPHLSGEERLRMDARARVRPTAYADRYPERWTALRRSRLTSLLMRLRTVVKRRRPDAVFSAALVPDEADALAHRFQDWRTWLESGLLDVACPMAYTQDPAVFESQIAAIREIATSNDLWAGIGAYRLSPGQTIDNIRAARRHRADGIVLFSYDSLTDQAQHGADYLAQVAEAAFGINTVATGSR
ncbi:MAG: family 10 glycosylhydrolase [Vicinamibacterales bacterium]|jgi:uncharacterized lipoprotein YddW (UPF0748 family)|nr:family 10 glycosylhydrolase [Vicinamibacterales bacterium]MDP7671928.1 family 10 glycosylhydrolase [Vicinamibacterales bacterium]HJO37598.1 family 10 glycosylhydrolase [Vicinamibacterales bacterium]